VLAVLLVVEFGAMELVVDAELFVSSTGCPVVGVGQAFAFNTGSHVGETHSDVTVFESTPGETVTGVVVMAGTSVTGVDSNDDDDPEGDPGSPALVEEAACPWFVPDAADWLAGSCLRSNFMLDVLTYDRSGTVRGIKTMESL